MAKRAATRTQIVRMTAPRPVAPIVRVQMPRAAPVHHRKGKGKGGHRKGGGGGMSDQAAGIAGLIVGLVEKQGLLDKLPSLPLLGKKGTAAVVLHYFAKGKGGITRDVKLALCVMAGYDLGKTGAIMGGGGIAPQVGAAGVSSQV
jgi:hypothetical protein